MGPDERKHKYGAKDGYEPYDRQLHDALSRCQPTVADNRKTDDSVEQHQRNGDAEKMDRRTLNGAEHVNRLRGDT